MHCEQNKMEHCGKATVELGVFIGNQLSSSISYYTPLVVHVCKKKLKTGNVLAKVNVTVEYVADCVYVLESRLNKLVIAVSKL